MARQLEEDPPEESPDGHVLDDGKLAARYLEQEVAMGKQKVLGYMAVLLATIHGMLAKGKVADARLMALLGIAS
eukprot:8156635-Lingulodinium_polyedra.AAC.1